jgi:hypothetical protein
MVFRTLFASCALRCTAYAQSLMARLPGRTSHVLSLTVHADGIQMVWSSSRTGQPPQMHRTWPLRGVDALTDVPDIEWPRGTTLRVALPDAHAVCRVVRVAPGLSWRDRRFQQAAELLAQSPSLGDDVACDTDAGVKHQVCALPLAVVAQWHSTAQAWGCRLQWLGLGRSLQGQPLAHLSDPDHLQTLTPNWAGTDGSRWWRDGRLLAARRWRVVQRRTPLRVVWLMGSLWAGALVTTAAMHALAALGAGRDALTRPAAYERSLQDQRGQLLATQAQHRSAWQQHADAQGARQELLAHAQASASWLHTLQQAPGVWWTRVALQPEGDRTWRWHVQGEALSPQEADRARDALMALPLWRTPPQATDGHWQHGVPGRFSVWVFELHAELARPW